MTMARALFLPDDGGAETTLELSTIAIAMLRLLPPSADVSLLRYLQ